MAYRVALPPTLLGVQNIFHVYVEKVHPDPTHIIDYEPLQIQEKSDLVPIASCRLLQTY